jgi:hypothetical protein
MAQFKTKILCFWINLLAKKEIKHMLNPELFMRVKNHRFIHGIITTVHFQG